MTHQVRLTGWRGGTFGLRVSTPDRDRVFVPLKDRLTGGLTIVLPGETPMPVNVTDTFWTTSPEFRSSAIGSWMKERGDCPWPHGAPPEYVGELLTGQSFRNAEGSGLRTAE